MDVKVTINGVDVVVTASNAAEAAEFVRSMLGEASPKTTAGSFSSSIAVQADVQNDAVDLVLRDIKGNPSARFLLAMSKHPGGCWDSAIRQEGGIGDRSLAPLASHVSKVCNRHGLSMDRIYTKKVKRIKDGKMTYFFTMKPEIIGKIQRLSDFATPAIDFTMEG